jgi:hypothetical protein
MFTLVLAHINELTSFPDRPEGGLNNRFRLSDKSYYGTISGFARIYIEQPDSFHLFNFFRYPLNDPGISAFTEIRNAFNYG